MISILTSFAASFVSKNAKYVFAFIALLTCLWQVNSWFKHQAEAKATMQAEVSRLAKDLDTSQKNFELAQATAIHNKEMLDLVVADKQKAEAIATDLKKDVAASRSFSQQLLGKINTSKPEDDGPISPVLRETIDTIQKQNKETN